MRRSHVMIIVVVAVLLLLFVFRDSRFVQALWNVLSAISGKVS